MNWRSRRRLFVVFRQSNIVPRRIQIVGLVAICLAVVSLRIADARQNEQAVTAQATASDKYLNTRPGVEYVGDEGLPDLPFLGI